MQVIKQNNWGHIIIWVGRWGETFLFLLYAPRKSKDFCVAWERNFFFSHIDCKWEREDISPIRKAAGWWYQGRGNSSLQQQSVLPLLHLHASSRTEDSPGANMRDPDCRSGSSEKHQHVLIFNWQQPGQERRPFPSHPPSDDWTADSGAVLLNTHSKMPAINFSHSFPYLPSSRTLPAHFALPHSRLKPLHILLALFQLSWHNRVSPISNHAFPGMIPIGNLQFW